jgi:taurine transport system ATP-binding protein
VEEACYLGTRVVVMSPRPGRIMAAVSAPFSARESGGDSRAVKSSPEFIELRERILKLIWHEDN